MRENMENGYHKEKGEKGERRRTKGERIIGTWMLHIDISGRWKKNFRVPSMGSHGI